MSNLFSQLTFARYFMPMFLPGVEKAIYLDDDVIVQGMVTFIIAFVNCENMMFLVLCLL